jgi:protein O-GlcNAc transferase
LTRSDDNPENPAATSRLTLDQAFHIAFEHHRAGRLPQAESFYKQILNHDPKHVGALHYLGVIAHQTGQNQLAEDLIRRAIAQRADYPQAYCNLGSALRDLRRFDEAVAAYQHAIKLNPNLPEAFNFLGDIRRYQGLLDDAIADYQNAVSLRPDYEQAHISLGSALKDIARIEEAMAEYRRAMQIDPADPAAHSYLIYTMHLHNGSTAQMILDECRAWDRRHAQPLRESIPPHDNDRDPDRPLRIGYLSPDFRDHVVGRNMLPLLGAHNPGNFQVACYALMLRHDPMTQRFQSVAKMWRDVATKSDEQIAQIIRQDRIDILVDLAVHTEFNRLRVMARKPAPVQVTFAGYPGTTGIATVDYRLTDPYLDPRGMHDQFYSEQSIRLPDSFWCYDPKQSNVLVNDLPAQSNGVVTFGCLNNFCKVNSSVLAAWAAILAACPGSRMMILAGVGQHRHRAAAALGVAPDRLAFVERCPHVEYLKRHHTLDIILDTFPYNGHTTSCDALWMGVPVVTLVGQTAVGRGGLSLLSNLGLTELVADSPQKYIQIATDLAHNPGRMANLRATLRQSMLDSALTDMHRYARNIEAAYRQMWRTWCQNPASQS